MTPAFRAGSSRKRMWELLQTMPPCEVARRMSVHPSQVHTALQAWRKKGYEVPSFRTLPRERVVTTRVSLSESDMEKILVLARRTLRSPREIAADLIKSTLDELSQAA